MKFKPFRDTDAHEERNLFALDSGAGTAGQLVKVKGDGFVNSASFGVAFNINDSVKNVYMPRMEVKAKVTLAGTGDVGKPFGVMLYDTKEKGFERDLVYDRVRRQEAQCVVSGEAVPILRKGMLLVGPWGTGDTPTPGSGVVAGASGEWSVVSLAVVTGAARNRVFGEFLGAKDADGYALVDINCLV